MHSIAPLDFDQLQALAPRDRVCALEASIRGQPGAIAGTDFPVKHHVADGVYVREFFLAAGQLVIGNIHKHAHVMTIVGDVVVYDETGRHRYTGLNVFTSEAGVKRAVYAFADTVLMTAHRLRDLATTDWDDDKLREECSMTSYTEFNQWQLEGCPTKLLS